MVLDDIQSNNSEWTTDPNITNKKFRIVQETDDAGKVRFYPQYLSEKKWLRCLKWEHYRTPRFEKCLIFVKVKFDTWQEAFEYANRKMNPAED